MFIRNKSFWLVFAAFVLPTASLVLTVYALSFFLLEHFASKPQYVSLAELMGTLPIIAGFIFIGLATDRLHRKHLALAALVFRFLFAVSLLITIYNGWMSLVFAMLFCRMFFHKLFVTMEMAIIQGLLSSEEYVKAVSIRQLINGILAISGSFAALFLYQNYGVTGIIAIDCIFTLIAFGLMYKANIPETVSLPSGRMKSLKQSFRSILSDIIQGFVYVWTKPNLRSFLIAFMFFGIINAILATLPLYSIRFVLTSDVETYKQYAVIFSFLLGLSFILGSLSSPLWRKFLSPKRTILLSMMVVSVLLTLLGLIQLPWLFFLSLFIVGFFIVMINIVIGSWLPQIVDPAFMGRTYSLLDPAALSTKSLGLIVCSWVFPQTLSLTVLYFLFGAVLLIGVLSIWRLLK